MSEFDIYLSTKAESKKFIVVIFSNIFQNYVFFFKSSWFYYLSTEALHV